MDDLFNILSSSARIDKSKRKKKALVKQALKEEELKDDSEDEGEDEDEDQQAVKKSRDRTGKRDTSDAKLAKIHKEQIAAFRRSMNIRLGRCDAATPDPITRFDEITCPTDWWNHSCETFEMTRKAILRNIEKGRWKEPTPIQMQSIPTILNMRRDMIGAAPTGSGKSGAFLIPSVFIATASRGVFYNIPETDEESSTRAGEIRCLILAPSLELATQLHREVERVGDGKPGGISSILLAKTNAPQVISNTAGGKRGVNVLVATPMRLVDAIHKGLKLGTVRLVVLDEADRLLDASDGDKTTEASGSAQTQTFLSQMDIILAEVPSTAVRTLFSATVTPMVRSLSESILRNPLDITVGGTLQGGANLDIEQELTFVGKEEGKLLAIRQLVARGQLQPPVLIFLQSKERAQALFNELLYDGIHVDVIHAGRSKSAREAAVAKFRTGETWVLICTDLVARGVDFKAVNMVINYDLCSSAVTYVHRIGRTGRAGRKGKAITLFTEADFDNLRAIANVMRQSGCEIPEWMLSMKKQTNSKQQMPKRRRPIDTTPSYDKKKRFHKKQMIEESKKKKAREAAKEASQI